MSEVSEIVQVTVTRATRPLTQASFDTPLYLGLINFFNTDERTRVYTSTTSMISDGFPSNHPAVVFATRLFAQPQRPNNLIVGRQDYSTITLTPTVADDAIYTASIGVSGSVKEISITSDNSATAMEIVDALVTAINADTDLNSNVVASNSSDVLVLTPNAGNEVHVVAVTSNLVLAMTGVEDITTAITSAENERPNWFFLAAQQKDNTPVTTLAAWAEANDKMYLTSVDATTVADSSLDNDLASMLRTAQYASTTSFTRPANRIVEEGEGGMIGAMAASNPGVSTLFGKTLTGVSLDNFSASQRSTIIAKNSNYYDERGGAGFLFDGRQADGGFFDTQRFSLWAKARTAEAIFGLLKRKSDLGLKVPQSDAGDEMIRQAIFQDMINIGVARGAILTANDGATDPIVRIPNRSTRSAGDLANRILRDVEIELVYSGAVQQVIVQIFISL